MFANFNELDNHGRCQLLWDVRDKIPSNAFMFLLDETNDWEVGNLVDMSHHIGTIHLSRPIERRLKKSWEKKRTQAIQLVGGVAECGFPDSKRLYVNISKMYTHLHNGNMEQYVKYCNRILDHLNTVMTDSMDDDFLLFGFKLDKKARWELNTDRCTMELAKLMQIVRLGRDIWPTTLNNRITESNSTITILLK